MTLAPRDYIAERRREISQRMEQLRSELADLDRMESALGLGIPPLDGGIEVLPNPPNPFARPGQRRHVPGGIKGAIMAVLAPAHPKGFTSQELLTALKDKMDLELPRTSLSPQLSRLKNEKNVTVNDGVWTATDQGVVAYMLS